MLRRVTEASNRALTYVGLGALTVIVGLQIVIFAIWGDAGDPPDAVVAIGFLFFWGAVLVVLGVLVLAVKRRLDSRRR